MNTKSQQMQTIINKSGINTRRVQVLGSLVHVDTFAKYEGRLLDLMSTAGFAIRMVSNGVHLDGVDGFRMVFQVQ